MADWRSFFSNIDLGRLQEDDGVWKITNLTEPETTQISSFPLQFPYQIEEIDLRGIQIKTFEPEDLSRIYRADLNALGKNENSYNLVLPYGSLFDALPKSVRDQVLGKEYEIAQPSTSQYHTTIPKQHRDQSNQVQSVGIEQHSDLSQLDGKTENIIQQGSNGAHFKARLEPEKRLRMVVQELEDSQSRLPKRKSVAKRALPEQQKTIYEVCKAIANDQRLSVDDRKRFKNYTFLLKSADNKSEQKLKEFLGLHSNSSKNAVYATLASNAISFAYSVYEIKGAHRKKKPTRYSLFDDGPTLAPFPSNSFRFIAYSAVLTSLFLAIGLFSPISPSAPQWILGFVRWLDVGVTTLVSLMQAFVTLLLLRSVKEPNRWGIRPVRLISPMFVQHTVLICVSFGALVFAMSLAGHIVPSLIRDNIVVNPLFGPKIEAINAFGDVKRLLVDKVKELLTNSPFGIGGLSANDLLRSNMLFAVLYWFFLTNLTIFLIAPIRSLLLVPVRSLVKFVLR